MNTIATQRLAVLCALYLRAPLSYSSDDDGSNPVFIFDPVLTAAEQTDFNDLSIMAKFSLDNDLTLAQFQAIKSDLSTAKTYVGLASPTSAQTVAALKSTIRVIGALLRQ